jgi:YfiH family protein
VVTIYKSKLLEEAGFRVNGFTQRTGGVSSPPYDSLNLAFEVGDEPDHVSANLIRLKEFLQLDVPLFRVKQVHGDKVIDLSECAADWSGSWLEPPMVEADGLIGVGVEGLLAVQTADCAPVLLACPETGAVAAVHAGWRGTAKGVINSAVRAMTDRGATPYRVLAAVGPTICFSCFEVGEEVARCFPESSEPSNLKSGKYQCDLASAVEVSLIAAGLTSGNIDRVDICPRCESEELYSYRGSGGITGRSLGFIASLKNR